jgi:segregation and condensation protein A
MSDVEPQGREPSRTAAGEGGGSPGGPVRGGGTSAAGDGSGGDGMHVPQSGARVCEVTLDDFEGPLDLLLHLVRRHELDILDIPIAFVCEKYLEYIDLMRALDLEVAGDYLVMAATLAYLKSRELVPQQDAIAEEVGEDGELGGDPRQQLIMRLLEYQKYREAADRLDARPIAGRDTFARGGVVEMPPVDAGLAPITLFRLAEAYQRVLDRARIHKSHEVVMETISVAARMEQLTTLLIERSRFDFEALFLERTWSSESELRSMLVVTLMSILELVRMGVASVHQPIGGDTIMVERVASAEEAREALRGYDEALSFGDGHKPAEDGGVPPDEPGEGDEDDALDWQTLLAGAADDEAEDEGSEDAGSEDEGSEDEGSEDEGSEDAGSEAFREPAADVDDGASAKAVGDEHGATAADDAEREEALPDDAEGEDARVTEPASAEDDPPEAATGSAAADGPTPDDAGAHARSVVSESPPSPGAVVDAAREVAPTPTVEDGASESSEGDVQEHGENGKAEAVEGS